jgi:hypothetical protein
LELDGSYARRKMDGTPIAIPVAALQTAVEVKAWRNSMKNITLAATPVVALLLLLTAGAPYASADIYALTSDHCNSNTSGTINGNGCIALGDSSAGTITVTDISGGGVTITVALNSGFKFNSGGFDADFGFNLAGNPNIAGSDASPDTCSTPSGSNKGGPGTGTGECYNLVSATAGSLGMDGTGTFEYGFLGVFANGGGNGGPGPYTFTVTGVTAASFEQNANGQFFALDLLGDTGRTGAVDASSVSVPDGGMTLMLLGGALVGLESLRRRFRA